MSSAMYLEHYLDSLSGIESLPHDLQRNFTLMRDLDQRSQDLLKEIDKMAAEYITNVRSMAPDKRTQHLKSIENAFNKSRELNDDKVQLAMQTYEMVDKHIRKLDADLSRFEADLKEQRAQELGQVEEEVVESNPKPRKGRGRGRGRKSESEPASKRRKEDTSPRGLQGLSPLLGSEVQVLDMPVDPNEPTYCVCHQVSYGEMIGCDNPECPIEWFHFGCVGLSTKPKGKWFCTKCALDRKKK